MPEWQGSESAGVAGLGRLAVMFSLCDLFIYFFHFRQPYFSRPSTNLAEIWHADRKLVWVVIAGPKWLLSPKNILGAKNGKFSNGAYSSELTTLERKRISARLKRPWDREKMAYKTFVRPWPLTSECQYGEHFYMFKCKNFSFLRFPQNFLM